MSELDDELSVDINLRSPREIGERMVILAALIRMALLQSDDEDEEAEIDFSELNDLRDAVLLGAWIDGPSGDERDYIARSGGGLTESDLLAMMWRTDSLAALRWSIDPADRMPAPWQEINPAELIDAIPAAWDELDAFLASLSLRPEEAIAAERERNELWAWRCGLDAEVATTAGNERRELLETLKAVVEEAVDAKLLVAANGDFSVGGRPFREFDAETKALITERSFQRLHALNWICGFGSSWDDVPLDV